MLDGCEYFILINRTAHDPCARMGRMTLAARASFEEHLHTMRTEYKDALVSKGRREAFDRLVEAWSSELGAISYAESISLMDLLLLTGGIDNRAFTESLKLRLDRLEFRLSEVELLNGLPRIG
jgi:hypothetical protein